MGEFRAFIAKGNVLDLAVAVIIGAAFATIVASLTDDVIMPAVGAVFGGLDFSNYFILLGPVPEGFVAVAIGLVLLVAAAIFTARVPPEAPGSDLQPGRPGRQDRATPDDTGTAA